MVEGIRSRPPAMKEGEPWKFKASACSSLLSSTTRISAALPSADRARRKSSSAAMLLGQPGITLNSWVTDLVFQPALRGANMMTATPSRQIAEPAMSHLSGRKPSKAIPHSSDPATNTPP